jgi:rhamnose transport system ATP-binding protein
MSDALLAIEDLSKAYGGVQALGKVSLGIRTGEVHALCGENGAGKSTLIKCLTGVVKPDAGTISVSGKLLETGDVRLAEAAGIAVIHQESTSFPDLDAVDNLFVGREVKKGLLLDRAAMEKQAVVALGRLGLQLEVGRPLRSFTVAHRQMVEMARALLRDCRLLIMDEPTASLSARETEILLDLVKGLRADGVSVLYVSHRLEEVFALADRVTVLRDGQLVATSAIDAIDHAGLIKQMVGREVDALTRHGSHEGSTQQPCLEVRGLGSSGLFEDISLTVHRGEILGLGGLVGAGRSEVARAIFGVDAYQHGAVLVGGRQLEGGSVRAAMKAGIALVPEDRQHEGLVLPMPISENLTMAALPELSRFGLIDSREESKLVSELVARLSVRTGDPDLPVESLSGGNQQKVVLGKWLANRPDLLILDEPTRGVDVGAKAEIHRLIRELAAQGTATLVISSDLPELLAISDRILVMEGGRIRGELDGTRATQEEVLRLALPAGEASRRAARGNTREVSAS